MSIALNVAAIGVALLFIALGASIAFVPDDSVLLRVLGGLVAAYGIASLALIIAAWRAPSNKWPRIAAGASALFISVWVVGSFDSGMISGQETGAAAAAAGAAALIWYAISRASRSLSQR